MKISSGHGSRQPAQNINETYPEKAERAERVDTSEKPVEKLEGEQIKGQIIDIVKSDTPPSATIRLTSGELVKGNIEPPLPSDIKTGEYVIFNAFEENGRAVFQNVEHAGAKSGEVAKLAMMKSALEMAGLKVDADNLKLVSLLLENELPINKETIIAISRVFRHSGMESAEKAVLLMKNNIQPTQTALEKLNEYAFESGKLTERIEELSRNIMEMGDGAEKQRILRLFLDMPQDGDVTFATGASGRQNRKPQEVQILDALAEQPTFAEDKAAITKMLQSEIETGSKFFRGIFIGKQDAALHLAQNPPSRETQAFIDDNLIRLESGFSELVQKNRMTKEDIVNLIKGIVGEGKMPIDMEKESELKSFVLQLAEKSGILDENFERAERYGNALAKGAKRIAEKLSVLLDGKRTSEKLETVFENIKARLALVANELGLGEDSEKVKSSMESIKENMKFLSELKNNQLIEIPLYIDGQKQHAELYVFSRKGGKNKKSNSSSALLSLDLANLGHLETYVQKTEKSVICQFRPENEITEKLVRENIERLASALKEKKYSLDGFSFKKTEEKFTLSDEEPLIGERSAAEKHESSFSFDYRM